jgi:hypothetical protein
VADTRDQVLRVGLLQARGAAVQAKLADEAILLDHADRQRGVVRGAAELLLNADEGALATAEDEDLLQVDGAVAANGGGEEELRGRHCFPLDQIRKLLLTTEHRIQRQESNVGDFRREKISPGK